MKYKTYIVTFKVGPSMEMLALSEEEAKILAQAERIKNGMSHEVASIRLLTF